jgi:hypothetical protein
MTTATARSAVPLGLAWFVTALVVGPIGFLLFALSDGAGDRALGLVLAAAGVVAVVAGAVVLASGVRTWSIVLSGGFVVLGVVAAGVVLTATPSYVEDALLLGLPPVVGGVVTGLLALRR